MTPSIKLKLVCSCVMASVVLGFQTQCNAQVHPGNGVLLNPTDSDIAIALHNDSLDKELSMLPGARLNLRRFGAYDLYLHGPNYIYELDVSTIDTVDNNWQAKFYHFNRDNNGQELLAIGLPKATIASSKSRTKQLRSKLQKRWKRDLESGTRLQLNDTILDQLCLFEVEKQLLAETGLAARFVSTGPGGKIDVVAQSCRNVPNDKQVYLQALIRNSLNDPNLEISFSSKCCSGQRLTISQLSNVLELANEARALYRGNSNVSEDVANYFLGGIKGRGELKPFEEALRQYARLREVKTNASLRALRSASELVEKEINYLLCTAGDGRQAFDADSGKLIYNARYRIDNAYRLAALNYHKNDQLLNIKIDGESIVSYLRKNADGNYYEETKTVYRTVRLERVSFEVEEGVKVKFREQWYCNAESMFPGDRAWQDNLKKTWKDFTTGMDGNKLGSGIYCFQFIKNGKVYSLKDKSLTSNSQYNVTISDDGQPILNRQDLPPVP